MKNLYFSFFTIALLFNFSCDNKSSEFDNLMDEEEVKNSIELDTDLDFLETLSLNEFERENSRNPQSLPDCVSITVIIQQGFKEITLDFGEGCQIGNKNISGIIIGFISVLLGIGGGSLMVPFMRTFGYDIRRSIGTAAGVGFLIAVFGTITMITGGKIVDNINTPYSLGYVNLLGFLVFVPVTMIMARVGAKAVYKIDKNILSKIFGIFLIIVSIRSFFEYLSIN